jgi:hypothetical protein
MLDWERWTLTHSSAGAAVPVLALLLFPGLVFEPGLVATWTSSAAAVAEVPGVPEVDADDVGEVSPEGDGVAVWVAVWRGALLALRVGADWVGGGSLAVVGLAGELVEGEGDGDWDWDGEGEGERRGKGDGDGEGVGVADDGSAWHTLLVVAGVDLGVAAGAACAVPAATPRVRRLPLSKMTAAALACAKRIRIARLRCSSGLPRALRDSEATRGRMGTGTHFRKQATYASLILRFTTRPARATAGGPVFPRQHRFDALPAGSVP